MAWPLDPAGRVNTPNHTHKDITKTIDIAHGFRCVRSPKHSVYTTRSRSPSMYPGRSLSRGCNSPDTMDLPVTRQSVTGSTCPLGLSGLIGPLEIIKGRSELDLSKHPDRSLLVGHHMMTNLCLLAASQVPLLPLGAGEQDRAALTSGPYLIDLPAMTAPASRPGLLLRLLLAFHKILHVSYSFRGIPSLSALLIRFGTNFARYFRARSKTIVQALR